MSVFSTRRAIGRFVADRLTKLPRYRKREFRMVLKNNHALLDANLDTQLGGNPGKYSLRFYETRLPWLLGGVLVDHEKFGHAVVSEKLEEARRGKLKRKLETPIVGRTNRARTGWLSGWLGTEPEHFGSNIARVNIETRDGWLLPSWLQTHESKSWIIHVHGRGATPAETARNFESLQKLGFNNLSISYRQDHEARRKENLSPWLPGQRHHRVALGTSEWRDIEAAVEFAKSNGAKHIVIFGWSYGAAVSYEFASRSEIADSVAGYIFDSPVISWRATLQRQLELAGLPAAWVKAAANAAGQMLCDADYCKNIGLPQVIDFEDTEPANLAKRVSKPTLILHSKDDGYIPFEPSFELAKANECVQLVEFERARHCKLYNFDQCKYEEAVSRFLKSL